MSFFNLTAGEFIALFGSISAVLVTLYLLDRSRHHQIVATLRFWKHAETNTELRQRKRIQQPWSLILQLVSMALLLLAIAQLQWGSLERNQRDHVLILDTSAWMGARTARSTLMDEARTAALKYVRAVPAADRILLVRADGLATPATPLGSNHAAVERAIIESKPSSSALNLDQALEFAQRAQSGQGRKAGEIVYDGPGRVAAAEGVTTAIPENLRVLPVESPLENCGIRKIGLRRSPSVPDEWEVFISTRNYGTKRIVAPLAVQFGGAPIGSRVLTLAPGADQETSFTFRTKAAGLLEARLLNSDAFQDDNRAVLEVPSQKALRVIVYTDSPELLKPVLGANPRISAQFRPPASYDPKPDADVVILDRFAPTAAPKLPSLWIEPPAQHSPVAVRAVVAAARLTRWNSEHETGLGLRTKGLILDTAQVFTPEKDDITVAETDRGPLIVARPQTAAHPKQIVLGFHPVRSSMKYELATPLVFANLLRWVRPELFRRWELNGSSVGAVETELDKHTNPETVQVISDTGKPVPYTINGDHLRFFAGTPGSVRIQAGDREIVYSLTLPETGLTQWVIPAKIHRGIPHFGVSGSPVTDLWPWLALAGALGLLAEWLLYGRGRRGGRVMQVPARARQKVLQRRAS